MIACITWGFLRRVSWSSPGRLARFTTNSSSYRRNRRRGIITTLRDMMWERPNQGMGLRGKAFWLTLVWGISLYTSEIDTSHSRRPETHQCTSKSLKGNRIRDSTTTTPVMASSRTCPTTGNLWWNRRSSIGSRCTKSNRRGSTLSTVSLRKWVAVWGSFPNWHYKIGSLKGEAMGGTDLIVAQYITSLMNDRFNFFIFYTQ